MLGIVIYQHERQHKLLGGTYSKVHMIFLLCLNIISPFFFGGGGVKHMYMLPQFLIQFGLKPFLKWYICGRARHIMIMRME